MEFKLEIIMQAVSDMRLMSALLRKMNADLQAEDMNHDELELKRKALSKLSSPINDVLMVSDSLVIESRELHRLLLEAENRLRDKLDKGTKPGDFCTEWDGLAKGNKE